MSFKEIMAEYLTVFLTTKLSVFKETLGNFPASIVTRQTRHFKEMVREFPNMSGDRKRSFQDNIGRFL